MKGNVWSGLLLILVGVWLVMQVVVGDLPGRLLSWSGLYSDGDPSSAAGEPEGDKKLIWGTTG